MWYLKQLLPLRYRSVYISDGKVHDTRWRMCVGQCFGIRDRSWQVHP